MDVCYWTQGYCKYFKNPIFPIQSPQNIAHIPCYVSNFLQVRFLKEQIPLMFCKFHVKLSFNPNLLAQILSTTQPDNPSSQQKLTVRSFVNNYKYILLDSVHMKYSDDGVIVLVKFPANALFVSRCIHWSNYNIYIIILKKY